MNPVINLKPTGHDPGHSNYETNSFLVFKSVE